MQREIVYARQALVCIGRAADDVAVAQYGHFRQADKGFPAPACSDRHVTCTECAEPVEHDKLRQKAAGSDSR